VSAFALRSGSVIKSRAQIQPNVPDPAANVNFLDIAAAVGAFQGVAYPFSGPSSCP
jgi:hypothetical protein